VAENSKIEWTDHTFNPWIGCTKVSPACDNCYAAEMMDTRYGRAKWGAGELRVRTAPSRPMSLEWARSLQRQSFVLGRVFNFKQVGGRGSDKGGHTLDGATFFDRPSLAA
jgi:protein gp37